MPFLRFSRDKRGYEYVYLVHAATRRGKVSRPRLLYWYRTPPGVKVGRKPFDEEAQRMIEAQNPGVVFDWAAIIATPPPPEPEPWRERRRAERSARQARREESPSDEPLDEAVESGRGAEEEGSSPGGAAAPTEAARVLDVTSEEPTAAPSGGPAAEVPSRKRRRRRGGRRRGQRPDRALQEGGEEAVLSGETDTVAGSGVADTTEVGPSDSPETSPPPFRSSEEP